MGIKTLSQTAADTTNTSESYIEETKNPLESVWKDPSLSSSSFSFSTNSDCQTISESILEISAAIDRSYSKNTRYTSEFARKIMCTSDLPDEEIDGYSPEEKPDERLFNSLVMRSVRVPDKFDEPLTAFKTSFTNH